MSLGEMVAGCEFSKVVVVQSLDRGFSTGASIKEYIEGQVAQHNRDLPVELVICNDRFEFLEYIETLIRNASEMDEIPILHIECHGDIKDGLQFADGTELSWDELSEALTKLNCATGFNLIVVISACFGAYFLGYMDPSKPAPCWCLVAPTEIVDPGELYSGFRAFYREFLQSLDAGKAVNVLAKIKLSHGRWLGKHAGIWFEEICIGYFVNHCSAVALRGWARGIRKRLKGEGQVLRQGHLVRKLRHHSMKMPEQYFKRYFMVDKCPENAERFKSVLARIRRKLYAMK